MVHTCQCNTDLLVKLSPDSSSCVPGKCTILSIYKKANPCLLDSGLQLNVHKLLRRRHVDLLNSLCKFNLCPVYSTYLSICYFFTLDLVVMVKIEKKVWKIMKLLLNNRKYSTDVLCLGCMLFLNTTQNAQEKRSSFDL